MSATERKMMLGSEHKLDYLIIKERKGTGLAIKPVFAANSTFGLCIALKVRVAQMPSNNKSPKKSWRELWPELKWAAVDESRASTTIVRFSGKTTYQLHEAIAEVDTYTNSLIDHLDKVFEGLDHPKADAVEFVKSVVVPCWNAAVEALKVPKTDVDLDQVYVYPDVPGGYMTKNSVESTGPGFKAAAKAAQKAFHVIEGGKGHGPDFESDVEPEDDDDADDDAAEDEDDDEE